MPGTTQTAPRSESRDLGLQTRLAPISSVNTETRTVDLVWTTGARVRRYDFWNDRYYLEELSLDPAHVRMERLQSGKAPLLNSHSRYSLNDVIGVVESAALGAAEGTASVRFSKRDDVEPIYQDVVDKIVRQVSVGYSVFRIERIAPAVDGDLWIYRAIDWEPNEISFVSIGADGDAGTRGADGAPPAPPVAGPNERMTRCEYIDATTNPPAAAGISTQERTMPGVNTTTPPAAPNAADQQRAIDEARQAGIEHEATRQAGIREAVTLGNLEPAFADQLISQRGLSAADAGLAVLREQAKRSATTPTRSAAHIDTTDEQAEGRREAMTIAVMHRANPRVKLTEGARQFRSLTLRELCREELERAGVNTRNMSAIELSGVALGLGQRSGFHTTSDLPGIFGAVVSRTMRSAYAEAPKTFPLWARAGTLNDFRPVTRVAFDAAVKFEKINEAGEYKYGTLEESGETYRLATYGKAVAFTRQMLINDDLSALERLPQFFGRAAADMESDIVYGILTGNPKMSDGKTLFHADHKNIGAGAALSIASLSEARRIMRVQPRPGEGGGALNLAAKSLLVPAALETLAWQLTKAQYVGTEATTQNPFVGTLEPIVESRLDVASVAAWFLAADPGQIDTVEYSYLTGEEGLYTEQATDFDIEGIKVKGRIDFAAKAIDWRGLFKNPGA